MELRWALGIAFLGVTVITCASFALLSEKQKKQIAPWFIVGLILIWLGTIWQMTLG